MKRLIATTLFYFLIGQLLIAQPAPRDTLLIGYTQAPPFIMTDQGQLEGLSVFLWDQTAKELNLPFKYVELPFSDMLQALEEERIDLSINPLTITHERDERIDFTHAFYASNATVAIHEARPITRLFQFIKSLFNLNFLRGFLALIALIALFGWLMWHFEKKANPAQFRPEVKGMFDGIWWSIVTMTTVGYGDKTPKSRGGKIVALIWMISGLLFVSGFTASVASTLTVNQLSSDADSIHALKKRPIGCVKNSGTAQFLKANFFKKITLYDSVLPGLTALEGHQIDAFLYDEPILKYRINESTNLSSLEILPIRFNAQFYAFGVPENRAEFRDKVSQQILKEIERREWKTILAEYDLFEM